DTSTKKIALRDFIDVMYVYQLFTIDSINISPLIQKYDSLYKRITYEVAYKDLAYRAKSAIVTRYLQSTHDASLILKSLQKEMIINEYSCAYWKDDANY